jgi:DNA polymerase elongation subunit (family B)
MTSPMTDDQLVAYAAKLRADISSKNTLQEAIKVTLNSLYGACGNRWFRFYDIRLAEGITRTGRLVILCLERACNRWISKLVGTKGDWCLAIDTDSVYLCMEDLRMKVVGDRVISTEKTTDLIDAFCKKIQAEAIDPALSRLAKYLNCPVKAISMKREAIASGGFWVATKKYALDVIDMEGVRYAEPKMKITGLEVIKSSTPKFCQEELKKAVELIIRGDDEERIFKFITKVREEFMKQPLIEMSRPGSINELVKYRGPNGAPMKGTPYNSRCALVYNQAIGFGSGVEGKYQPIKPGDKVRFIALKMPNPYRSNAIAFPDVIPPELNLDTWADRPKMFEDYFLRPLTLMCDRISVLHSEKPSIQNFWEF